MKRRTFLGLAGAATLGAGLAPTSANAAAKHFEGYPDSFGVIFDASRCIGCRKCEEACNKVNKLPEPEVPFTDLTVMNEQRRTHAGVYTIVNKYATPGTVDNVTYHKFQCRHCAEPACASSCFVKAFTKNPDGSVTYNASVCVGCRYCMVACPFYAPTYQYDHVFTPKVQKCTFCHDTRLIHGEIPGCVEACPKEAMTFGARDDVIAIARQRMADNPGKYIEKIYGETEMGGTAWMVIAPVEFEQIGLDTTLGDTSAPEYTSGALAMVPMIVGLWPALLGGIYSINKWKERRHAQEQAHAVSNALQRAGEEAEAKLSEALAKKDQESTRKLEIEIKKAVEDALKDKDCKDKGEGPEEEGA